MAGAFLYQNRVTQGVGLSSLFASSTGLPLSNLIDDQPRTRARLIGSSSAGGFYASVVIDLLAQVSVECVALISTTLDSDASSVLVRARLSTADDTGIAGDAWDTGVLAAQTSVAANGNVVLVRAAGAVTGRYLLVEVGAHKLQTIDLGRVIAGPLWRLAHSHAYGIQEGRVPLDRRDRNALTGAEFPVASLINPRSATFTLPVLTSAEAIGEHRTMVSTIGAAGEVLWIPDTGLSLSEMNLRSLWGAHVQPGEVAATQRLALNVHSRSFRITERV
jgi:hypothetical protein